MTPTLIEWPLGTDIHNRLVTLRQVKTYDGKIEFQVVSAPANQRDEGEHITSLSGLNLLAICQIVRDWK